MPRRERGGRQGRGSHAREVWLTPSEVANAGIVVAPVEEQDVDNTILMAGKVAFDDTHVTHVFSPVSVVAPALDEVGGDCPLRLGVQMAAWSSGTSAARASASRR